MTRVLRGRTEHVVFLAIVDDVECRGCLAGSLGAIVGHQIENCVFSLERQRPQRLNAIEFPEGIPEEIPNSIPEFIRLEKSAEGMVEKYTRTVRCSDLDKSNHMTNLRYIDMFQDAYGKAFWNQFDAKQMEICFLSQCREGETLSVRSREDGNSIYMAAVHEDESLAAVCLFAK